MCSTVPKLMSGAGKGLETCCIVSSNKMWLALQPVLPHFMQCLVMADLDRVDMAYQQPNSGSLLMARAGPILNLVSGKRLV